MKKKIASFIHQLERHVDSSWYPFALAGIAIIDNFIYVIPMIAVLITSIFAAPKKWFALSLGIVCGSVLGSLVFWALVTKYGVIVLQTFAPSVMEGGLWLQSKSLLTNYGLWALWLSALLPVSDQPMIILVALAKIPLLQIIGTILTGKSIKFILMGWLASHAPAVLLRFKIIRKDVQEISMPVD